MKKVLYITNIEVPYRVRFFNELAKHCDLTVLFEKTSTANRNEHWTRCEKREYKVKFLRGLHFRSENIISLGIIKEIFNHYDEIVVGCYNSPAQVIAILILRLLKRNFALNLDGEIFLKEKNFKSRIKLFFLFGADKYLVAGKKAAQSLKNGIQRDEIVPYYFSSLTEKDLEKNKMANATRETGSILVVGQYFDYKGMDICLEAARRDASLTYKFIGMGPRTDKFLHDFDIPENVEIIPFLQKKDLEEEYKKCAMLVLPSRQECWGLVINEAASFGTPIVSTWGSGAAVEFLSDAYPQYLAKPGDADDLYACICKCLNAENKDEYSKFLLEKSKKYTIEASVQAHLCALLEE